MGNARSAQRQRKRKTHRRAPVGAAPGTMIVDPASPRPSIRVMAYGPEALLEREGLRPEQVREILESPSRPPVVWIDVVGLGDAETITSLGQMLNLHRLALEDVINVHQRPKVDAFVDALFVVVRMAEPATPHPSTSPPSPSTSSQAPAAGPGAAPAKPAETLPGALGTDQLSLFLGKGFVLTFQERPGDCFDPVRRRIRENIGRIRSVGADYLTYSLIDAAVDAYFPIIEELGDRLDAVEERILSGSGASSVGQVHRIRRDLLTIRRAAWPLRDALAVLYRDRSPLISDETRLFLRDCYDHAVQIIDLFETYREIGSDLAELHLTQVNNRINEVTKILAVVATIFIPLNFVAALYGMNFDPDASPYNMPELRWRYGYPAVLLLMALIAGTMVSIFVRRGWITRRRARAGGLG